MTRYVVVAVVVSTVVLTVGLWMLTIAIGRTEQRAADELHHATEDVVSASTWEAMAGTTGRVDATVIDACTDLPVKLARYRDAHLDSVQIDTYANFCPLAIRGALRFYGGIGGTYGCEQAYRAMAVYGSIGDDLSRDVIARCDRR